MTTRAKIPKSGSLVTYYAHELGTCQAQEEFFGIVLGRTENGNLRIDWMDGLPPTLECPYSLEILSE